MTDPLYVQPDGMRSYARIHDDVVAGLSQLIGAAAPEAAGVQTTHGAIASAVSTALSGVLGSRQGTLGATGSSGSTISELLHKAAQMYEHGDQKGAATLRAAAEALEGSPGASAPVSSGAGATGASGAGGGGGGAGGGADMMGQMVSQVGQQVGQMAQSVAQPLQGLAKGLQQVPQQVMQGAQQIAQQVSHSAGTSGGKTPGESGNSGDGRGPGIVPEGRIPEEQRRDQAAAGDSAAAGRAPDLPPAERAEPAQTRPQSD
jgi:ESX secretion-associated protein EspJ